MGKAKIKAALQLAGNQHKFQKTLVILICLAWIEINFVLLGSTLIYMDPIFNCAGDTHTRYQQQEACGRNDCQLVDHFTMTAQLGMYCDKEWARDTIQSIFSIGSFAGLIVMNIISDTKGRKISTILSLSLAVVGVISAILGGVFKLIPLLIFAQACGGFGAYAIITLSFALLSDFCSEQFRPRAIVIVNSAWGFSTFFLGVFYLIQVQWFTYLLYLVLIPLIILSTIMYMFICESPYILMNQNKREEALEVLVKIATFNNRLENIQKIKDIMQHQVQRTEENQASFKNVFKLMRSWKYFKPIILLTVIYGIGNLNFFGLSYSFDMEGLGFGYNSIIAGLVELLSFAYLNYAVGVLPRRKGIPAFYTVVLLIGLTFLTSWVNDNYIVGTVLLGISRLFSTISYTLIACMQVQAFTVEIQSTAAGFIEAFSLYGAFLAPLIVDLSDKIGINSIALISMFVSFAIWPNIFLDETLNKEKKKDETNPLLSGEEREQVQKKPFDPDMSSNSTLISLDDQDDGENR